MKVLDYDGLIERGIKYSKPHLWRMWNAGAFPRPFKISKSRNGWVESEIDAWLEARIATRDQAAA